MTRTILRSLFDRLGNTAAKWAACLLATVSIGSAWAEEINVIDVPELTVTTLDPADDNLDWRGQLTPVNVALHYELSADVLAAHQKEFAAIADWNVDWVLTSSEELILVNPRMSMPSGMTREEDASPLEGGFIAGKITENAEWVYVPWGDSPFTLEANTGYRVLGQISPGGMIGAMSLEARGFVENKGFGCSLYLTTAYRMAHPNVVITLQPYLYHPSDSSVRYSLGEAKRFTFGLPDAPEAVVTKNTAYNKEVNLVPVNDILGGGYQYGTVTPNVAYTFEAKDTLDEASSGAYSNWKCDYIVSMDADTDAYSIGLFGQYGWGAVAFPSPVDAKAGQKIPLLMSVTKNGWNYSDIVRMVRSFTCGAINFSEENIGKTITVSLVMWNEDNPVYKSYENPYVVEEIKYKFETVTPLFASLGSGQPTPVVYRKNTADEYGFSVDEDGYLVTDDNGNLVVKSFAAGEPHFAMVADNSIAKTSDSSYSTADEAVATVEDNKEITVNVSTSIGSEAAPAGSTVTTTAGTAVTAGTDSAAETTVTPKTVTITSGTGSEQTVKTVEAYVVSQGSGDGKKFSVVTDVSKDETIVSTGKTVVSDFVKPAEIIAKVVASENLEADKVSSMVLSLVKTEAESSEPELDAALVTAIGAADKAFEVHPVATITTTTEEGTTATTSYAVANSELAEDASFTFTLDFGAENAGKFVSLTHYAKDGTVKKHNGKDSWTETLDANGIATVTLTEFSYLLGTVSEEPPVTYVAAVTVGGIMTNYSDLHEALEAGKAAGSVVTLLADVDLAGVNWTPFAGFNGVFDGAGHTIRNLTINSSDSNVGLFSNLDNHGKANSAIVKNVTIHNVTITGSGTFVGALTGYISAGTVDNCHVTGTISITGKDNVGGLIGEIAKATVANCSVDGGDKAQSVITTIVSNDDGRPVGGFVSLVNGAQSGISITDCSVKNVSLRGHRKIGGFVGQVARDVPLTNVFVENVDIVMIGTVAFAEAENPNMGGLVGLFANGTKGGSLSGGVTNVNLSCVNDGANAYVRMGVISGGDYKKSLAESVASLIESGDITANVAVGGENSTTGSEVVDDKVIIYSAKPVTYVAQIGTTKYETLAEAILAAQSGDTIEILDGTWGADAVGTMTTSESLSVRAKSLTIQAADGASPKFTSTILSLGYDDSSTTRNAAITVRGLAFENTMLLIGNYPQVTVEDCSFVGSNGNSSSAGALAIIESCASNYNRDEFILDQVTVRNCTFDGTNSGQPALRLRNSGNVLITGNTIANSKHNGILFESNGTVNTQVTKTVVVQNNTINEWNSTDEVEGGRGIRANLGTMASGSTVTISDNTFRKDPAGLDTPDFVKITGAGSAAVDISGNDWNDMLLSEVKDNSAVYTSDAATTTITSVITTRKEPVAQIGTTKYTSLAEAIAAVPTTGAETTITMIANSAEPAVITVASGKNVVLDLNGKTVSYTTDEKNVYFLTNKGRLTVRDTSANAEGMILLTAQADKGYSVENVTLLNEGGTLTLESGTVKNLTPGGLTYAVKNSSNAWASNVVSTFNMTGGVISAPQGDGALRVYQNTGVGWKVQSKNYVNISGGTILDTGIFFDTYLYTVNQTLPADFAANDTAVGCDIDTVVNISGGTINGLIDMKIRHPYNTRLNITGGDFANCKMWVRKVSNEYGSGLASGTLSEPTDPMVYISGGKFAFIAGKAFGLSYDCGATSWTSYAKPYAVSGGVFNVEVPATACAEGKTGVANTETETKDAYPYTVGVAVAQIGTTKYGSLADAFAAANAADEAVTITMLADSELVGNIGYKVNAGSDITLDLNGKTVSQVGPMAGAGYLIENQGTLTLKDSTDVAKNGTGTGKMTTSSANPDTGTIPSYANNLITNYGTLTIESGNYKSLTNAGYASYVVDNHSGGTANITGGKLTNTAPQAYVVRMSLTSTTANNALNISGGIIEGTYAVWMQFVNSNANKATLNISGGTISATDGYAVYAGAADDSTRDASNIDVSFSGGTVGGSGVWLGSDTAFKSLEVSGGTYAALGASSSNEGFISGGTFESRDLFSRGRTDFTTVLADGYVLKDNQDGTYTVKKGTYVAQILENGYINISAPINEARDDVYIETANNYYFRGRVRTLVDEDGNTCPAYLATTDETVYYFDENGTKYGMSAKYIFKTYYLGEDYKYQTSDLFEIVPAVKDRYETLADAIAAAQDGDTIRMIANSAEPAVITVASGKNVVLDLNGKTVSYTTDAKSVYFLTNKGTLTVKDTSTNADGQILLTAQPDTGYSVECVTVYNLGGTLTLESGTIKNATGGGLAYAVNNSSNAWGAGDDKVSTFNMTGGKVSAPGGDAALRVYQNCAAHVAPVSKNYVNISGGTIVDTGIFVDTVLYTDSGIQEGFADSIDTQINISGGTVNGLIDLKIRHKNNTKLNITGGNFTNAMMWVRKKADEYKGDEPTEPMVSISGGKFAFVTGKAFGLAYDCGATSWTSYAKPYEVTGGVFNVEVPATACAEGKTSIANTETETKDAYPYTVGVAVAQIGTTKYETLAAAIAAVPTTGAETTITMIANEAIDIAGNALVIAASMNVVLDLNGFQVVGFCSTGETSALILNNGTLTIVDFSDVNADGTGTGKLAYSASPAWNWSGVDGDYSGSYASNLISNNGTVSVESGLLEVINPAGTIISASYAIDSAPGGVVRIKGGKLTSACCDVIRVRVNNSSQSALNISGGSVAAVSPSYRAIWVQDPSYNGNSTVTISGGLVSGPGQSIQNDSSGNNAKTTITGGTFNGFFFTYSELDISDGAFNGGKRNGTVFSVSAYGSKSHISGGVFYGFADFYSRASSLDWSVTGGAFSYGGPYQYASYTSEAFVRGGIYDDEQRYIAPGFVSTGNTDPDTKDAYPYAVVPAVASITIDDETTYYATFGDAIDDAERSDEEITITVVNYNAETMVAPEGWKFVTENDVTTLVKKAYVAQVGETKYETLAAALADVPADNTETVTIQLIADNALACNSSGASIVVNKNNVVIDGQGLYKITTDGSSDWDKYKVGGANQRFGQYNLVTVTGTNVTLKDMTIDGGECRGVSCATTLGGRDVTYDGVTYVGRGSAHYYGYGNGTITFTNCTMNTQGYAIHCSNENVVFELVVDSCTVNGWMSCGKATGLTIKNSHFGGADDTGKNGLLAKLRAYCNTTIENTTFSTDYLYVNDSVSTYCGIDCGIGSLHISLYGCSVVDAEGNPTDHDITEAIKTWNGDGENFANAVYEIDLQGDATDGYTGGKFVTDTGSVTCAEGYVAVKTGRLACYDVYEIVVLKTVSFALDETAPATATAPAALTYPSGSATDVALPLPTYTAESTTFAGWKVKNSDPEVILSAIPAGANTDYELVATWTGARVLTIEAEEGKETQVKVTDEWLEANGLADADDKAVKAALEAPVGGVPRWESYVLGQSIGAAVSSGAEQGETTLMPVTSTIDVPAADTGFDVKYRLDTVDASGKVVAQGTAQATPDLALELSGVASSAYYRLAAVVTAKDESGASVSVQADNTIGVLAVNSSAKSMILAVPWASLDDGGEISVSNLVRTATLTPGDTINAYDATTKKYKAWTLSNEKVWEPIPVIGGSGKSGAGAYTVPRGAGVWLKRSDTSKPLYLVGGTSAGDVVTAIEPSVGGKPAWNLVASPSVEPVNLSTLLEGKEGQAGVVVPTAGAPKTYTFKDGAWGYDTTEPVMKNGKQVGVRSVRNTIDFAVPAGTGFWYLNSSESPDVKIEW